MSHSNFFIRQMEIGPMQNYCYLLGDQKTKEAAIVDPGWEPEVILQKVEQEGLKITHIFVTHTHFDHVNALREILKATDAKVCVRAQEAPFPSLPHETLLTTQGGDKVKLGEVEVEFIHTPGHTPGSQCFFVNGALVSGDTLFVAYCGRTDLPGGDPETLYHSLQDKLGKLPPQTLLYPGHNYAPQPYSTLGREKKENPYMAAQSLNAFLRLHGKMI